jgi:Kef-type K+ transport system membrane component KefB
MPLDRDTWAIAFGLNARGATGIILAGVGRAAGVIDDRIFVAIVVMALVTSIIAGPMMNWLLSHRIAEKRLSGNQVELGGG